MTSRPPLEQHEQQKTRIRGKEEQGLSRSAISQLDDNTREGHITTILPLSISNDAGERVIVDFFMFIEAAVYLAIDQFNRRSGEILPTLPETLGDCDLYLTVDHRDSFFSPVDGARAYMDAFCSYNNARNQQKQRRRNRRKEEQQQHQRRRRRQQRRQQQQYGEYLHNWTGVPTYETNPPKLTKPGAVLPSKPSTLTGSVKDGPQNDVLPRETYAPFFNSSEALYPQVESPQTPYPQTASSATETGTETMENPDDESCRLPFAFVGAGRSVVSQTLSILGETFEMPLISPTSTSAELDQYYFFSRSVPTNAGDAKAIAMYLQHLGVSHVGIFYVRDPYGIAFQIDLLSELQTRDINSFSVTYHDLHSGEIENSIDQLVQAELRYFVGIFAPDTWRPIIQEAAAKNIMGVPGFAWIFTEGSVEFISPTFSLDRESEQEIAKALHGSAIIMIDVPQYQPFIRAMTDFANNLTAQEKFFSLHEQEYGSRLPTTPSLSFYHYFGFDAAMAFGIAACKTPGLFTSREFFRTFLTTEFEGVSGVVSFDNQTGTRSPDNIPYGVFNLLLSDEHSTPTDLFFTSEKAADVDFSTNLIFDMQPFHYVDNSTTPPLPLPPLQQNLNLIPGGARIIGRGLGFIVITVSLFWIGWTWYHRNDYVVRAAQPIFLCQLCVGTIIMATAIFPLGLQEPISVQGLDKGCMSIPWLLSIGFVTAFSALFSKTWRLNKLFNSGAGLRRIQVKSWDVMLPFFILMAINLFLLLLWTVLFPVRWVRVFIPLYDKYGRSVESYGTCRPYGNNATFGNTIIFAFIAPLFLANLIGVLVATYHIYIARNLPTDFSEARYLALSMFSLLETLVLAGPILFTTMNKPSVSFLIRAFLISIICSTILLPVFLPKYIQWRIQQKTMTAPKDKRRAAINSFVESQHKNTRNNDAYSENVHHSFSQQQGSNNPGEGPDSSHRSFYCDEGSARDFEPIQPMMAGLCRVRRSSQYYKQIKREGVAIMGDGLPEGPSSGVGGKPDWMSMSPSQTGAASIEQLRSSIPNKPTSSNPSKSNVLRHSAPNPPTFYK